MNPPQMMNDMVLHVGLPKTATTLLQEHLFPFHSEIDYLGKFIGRKSRYRDSFVKSVLHPMTRGNVFKADIALCQRLFRQSVAPTLHPGRIPLWSSEGLTAGSLRRQKARVSNLQKVFGRCRVILTLRHPLRMMESLYVQRQKTLTLCNHLPYGAMLQLSEIGDWLDQCWRKSERGALSNLQYAQTAELLADAFGDDAVGIFMFEQLRDDPTAFVTRLCAFLEIDAAEAIDLVAGKRSNERWRSSQLDRALELSNSFWKKIAFRSAPPSIRRRMLDNVPADKATRVARAPIPEHWQRRIEDLSRDGNRRLEQRWNLPLRHYEYPL